MTEGADDLNPSPCYEERFNLYCCIALCICIPTVTIGLLLGVVLATDKVLFYEVLKLLILS